MSERCSAGELGELGFIDSDWLREAVVWVTRGFPADVRHAAAKISKAVTRRSESLSWPSNWPSGDGNSVAKPLSPITRGVGFEGSLLELPSERSLKR